MFDRELKAKRAYYNALDYAKQEAIKEGLEIGREDGLKQGLKQGREQGREEGREQGREENTIQIVLAMLEKGIDVRTISEITKLPVEAIEKLSQK